jgi:hypothetical protein
VNGGSQGPSQATLPALTDEAAILKVDASVAPVQSALTALALDSTHRATMRYTARKQQPESRRSK